MQSPDIIQVDCAKSYSDYATPLICPPNPNMTCKPLLCGSYLQEDVCWWKKDNDKKAHTHQSHGSTHPPKDQWYYWFPFVLHRRFLTRLVLIMEDDTHNVHLPLEILSWMTVQDYNASSHSLGIILKDQKWKYKNGDVVSTNCSGRIYRVDKTEYWWLRPMEKQEWT